jgi:PTH1 family peptidyl-tRNA hydrolase
MDENKEFKPEDIKIVIGLGNPGNAYRATYHNIGFSALDRLSGASSETEWHKIKNFLFSKNGRLILVKPDNFMNESGRAVKQALAYFKTKPENLILIHDDSDIEAGSYKISFGRGAAGHRGVASIINELKTKNFWRIRIGVRSRIGKAENFILKKMTPGDKEKIDSILKKLDLELKSDVK